MKTNVTLKLDADLLLVRPSVVAAEEGRWNQRSFSTDRLEAIVRERKTFDKARRRALARLREGLDLRSGLPPRRATRSMSDRFFVDTQHPRCTPTHSSAGENADAPGRLWRSCGAIGAASRSEDGGRSQELAVNLRRKARPPLDARTTREIVTDYLTWHVVVNGGESIPRSDRSLKLGTGSRSGTPSWFKPRRRLARPYCIRKTWLTDKRTVPCGSSIR